MRIGVREIIFIVLLMGIPMGAYLVVFRPQNQANAQMLQQIQEKQAKLQQLTEATATMGDLRQEIDALQEAVTFFESKLPSEKEIDKVLKEVWRTATTNQLITKSIRTLNQDKKGIVEGSGPREQPILMQLQGDYMGFYGFLQALESQPRVMQIRSMQLQKLDEGPEGHMQAKFEMCIFFERSNEEQPCPPTASK
jgi:Tfp pilus assembly protein PilO